MIAHYLLFIYGLDWIDNMLLAFNSTTGSCLTALPAELPPRPAFKLKTF